MRTPRIALFSDSHDEANGVAHTTLAIEAGAKRRNIPVLSVHPCAETRLVHDGSIARLGLQRSRVFAFGQRHISRVTEQVEWFAPDVLHFIGPSDVQLLGASLSRRLNVPMVASWPVSQCVDTDMFTPARRRGSNAIVNIGYVGRLSQQEDIRLLHAVESELDAEGLDVRFTVVGDGPEREWLRRNMLRAEFTDLLCGDELADAYAHMDIFALPSQTDTGPNEVLEAMASGVPAVVMAAGGQRVMVDAGRTSIVAGSSSDFVHGVRALVKNRQRRVTMGIAARARAVDLFSWDRTFIDTYRLYDAAVGLTERSADTSPASRSACVSAP
jgi:glycosyltransferase involved in cell wall biosynthesis